MRGYYLAAKNVISLFDDPVIPSEDKIEEKKSVTMYQLALDVNYTCFSIVPSDLMTDYVVERTYGPKSKQFVFASGKLFRHMTNFVPQHHRWHK